MDAARDAQTTLNVGGEHRSVKAITRIVRNSNCLVLCLVWDHRHYGTENLFLSDNGVRINVSEDRRFDEPSSVQSDWAATAMNDSGPLLLSRLDIVLNPLAFSATDQQPNLRCRVVRVADWH